MFHGDTKEKHMQLLREFCSNSLKLFKTILADLPDDLFVSFHTCKGKGRWTGFTVPYTYVDIIEHLSDLKFNAILLEYDNDRSVTFEPLKKLSEISNATIIFGMITTKNGKLEDPNFIEARVREAVKYVSIERLGISPQCSFATLKDSNNIAEEEQ
jgi:5-methyltetrahydropteroyltriglutamate--homocysteine methyltransferase